MMKKNTFALAAFGLMLAGCSTLARPVAPDAGDVVHRLLTKQESPQDTQNWLERRGYRTVERSAAGGVFPRNGSCHQVRKGVRSQTWTIVRVCFADHRHPVVLQRDSKGYHWTEVFPHDLSNNLNGPTSLGAISDETVELLKR